MQTICISTIFSWIYRFCIHGKIKNVVIMIAAYIQNLNSLQILIESTDDLAVRGLLLAGRPLLQAGGRPTDLLSSLPASSLFNYN